jgi:dihydrolipoamide dehydrogenase
MERPPLLFYRALLSTWLTLISSRILKRSRGGAIVANVIVIGGGPGGSAAATRLAQLGAQVTLVEKELIGGNCVNFNCIPLTGMLASLELFSRMQNAQEMGIESGEVKFNLSQARARVEAIAEEMQLGIQAVLGSYGVKILAGTAQLEGPKTVVVDGQKLPADAVILAAGAKNQPPPLPAPGLLTHRQALKLDQSPKSLLVWGGGAIEVEFAQFFALLGSQVTLVEESSHLLPDEDYEVGQRLQVILGEQGVRVLTGAKVCGLQENGSSVKATVSQRKGESEIMVDRVLWTRQTPASQDLGLEQAGVRVHEGSIQVDAGCQTNVPGIYAIGDVTGEPMYSYVATVQGLVAAENALGGKRKLDLRAMPRCAYTLPEVACVGLSENDAEDQGYDVKVANLSLETSARALTLGEAVGGIKLVFDKRFGKLLGVHIVGHRATELIGEAALAIHMEVLAEDYAWALRGHPTIGESLLEGGRAFFGQALYMPKW